ncbi:Ger(x)C family spore germination protein [Marinisporobacter balticus]|uniref:Spore germination protein KC n=1 Tax=Marinisporobacter balticus TaxID=2018667 RepID=A0A4R2KXJ9_9FIRM|nr:Ger(x)C family spore germination protein [Marinisporobacter balticus]TCO74968.1 spore germination protein KC [Marinisporobacter balticus]
MKKIIFIFFIVFGTTLISGCWNYGEINDAAIAVGAAVDYDKQRDKILLTAEIAYPMIEHGETKIKSEMVKSEGKNLFEAIRNAIQVTGKKLSWAHAKVIIISEEVAKNKDVLIGIIDFIKRDAEYRENISLILSKEKTASEILKTDTLIQDIVSFQLEDIFENESGVGKYHVISLWKFVDDLATEGISPTLPTVRVSDFRDKKIAEMYGTGIFKGVKKVGWLNGDETKSFLFIIDEIKGGVITVTQETPEKPVKIALEIFKNKTKSKPIYENGEITIKINTKTIVNINELENHIDFTNEEGSRLVKKKAEKDIENKIKGVIKKVQKEYDSDIFGFGSMVEREYPELWKKIKDNWDQVFKDLKIEVKAEVDIRGSALRSKSIKVGD